MTFKSLLKPTILILTAFLFLFGIAACGNTSQNGPDSNAGNPGDPANNQINWPVSDFTFTDQTGKPFGLSDLKDKVWLADMIFTNCTTACSPMTANMAQLQKRAKEAGLDVQFVSFTVDPENDTPEVLTNFANKFGADFTNWHFLSGYELKDIAKLSESSFKSIVQRDPNSDQILHNISFFLVDKSGNVVKKYSGMNPPYDEIIQDLTKLTE